MYNVPEIILCQWGIFKGGEFCEIHTPCMLCITQCVYSKRMWPSSSTFNKYCYVNFVEYFIIDHIMYCNYEFYFMSAQKYFIFYVFWTLEAVDPNSGIVISAFRLQCFDDFVKALIFSCHFYHTWSLFEHLSTRLHMSKIH